MGIPLEAYSVGEEGGGGLQYDFYWFYTPTHAKPPWKEKIVIPLSPKLRQSIIIKTSFETRVRQFCGYE